MSQFVYEINNKNEVNIWSIDAKDAGAPPIIFQPCRPDGADWTDKSEAEEWTLNQIAIMEE